MQYAITAAHEALEDANWHPKSEEEQEMTVCPDCKHIRFPMESDHSDRASALGPASAASKKFTTPP